MKTKPQTGFPLHDYYSKIVGRYDLVNRLFTFGQDYKWRKVAADMVLSHRPGNVIDICCGTGDLSVLICRRSDHPVKLTGFDFNARMLNEARKKASILSIEDIEFIEGNVAEMPFDPGTFHAASIAFGLRNLIFDNPDSQMHIDEIRRILTPGGILVVLESASPSSPLINFFYRLYLKYILTPLGGIISGNWKAYQYLAKSSANFFNTAQLESFLEKNGFIVLSIRSFFMGTVNLIEAKKA